MAYRVFRQFHPRAAELHFGGCWSQTLIASSRVPTFRTATGQDVPPQGALCSRQCNLPRWGEEVAPNCQDRFTAWYRSGPETWKRRWGGGDWGKWPILSHFERLLLQLGRKGVMSHKLAEAIILIVFKSDIGLLKINEHELICLHHWN